MSLERLRSVTGFVWILLASGLGLYYPFLSFTSSSTSWRFDGGKTKQKPSHTSMIPPIPVLSDYGISPTHGFLPEERPLTRLPDPYYNKWEAVAANFPALILSKRLRDVVNRLPVLDTVGLEHESEWRRAYCLLCFVAHGYIWGDDIPADRLPPSISVPLLAVSNHLEMLPVATYAALCLWNFKPLFVDEEIDSLDNLATLFTFTGSLDESWFYLVSVTIEARGGPIVPLMLTAMAAARQGDADTVARCLRTFAERLDELNQLLLRMHENCDPVIFYHRIRPFLAGSKNMAEAGLPLGVMLDTGSGQDEYRQYSGGSNGQSSLIQFFDIALGIEHHTTGERAVSGAGGARAPPSRNNFITDMRRYMPGPHARFLRDVASVANIRDFVKENSDNHPLSIAYDACISMLSNFRDKHIALVTRYIVLPSREVRNHNCSQPPTPVRQKKNLAVVSVNRGDENIKDGEQLTGTGGSSLIPFLKQARDETGEPAVEEWTRQFISRTRKVKGRNDLSFGKDDAGGALPEVNMEVKRLPGT